MMLFSPGAPLTPIGGSSWSLRKSRINLRRAAVDMIVLEIEFNKIQQFKQFQCGQLLENKTRIRKYRLNQISFCAKTVSSYT